MGRRVKKIGTLYVQSLPHSVWYTAAVKVRNSYQPRGFWCFKWYM